MESKKRFRAGLDITARELFLPVPVIASETGTYPPEGSRAGLNVVEGGGKTAVLITVCHFT